MLCRVFGSNPYWSGDLFSWSSLIFFEIRGVMIFMAVDSRIASITVIAHRIPQPGLVMSHPAGTMDM